MSLENWLKAQWLVEHRTSPEEIADLLAIADRDIKSASSPGIDPDWKHNIAYSAALNSAAAALAARGYRPARGQHHYRLINSLPLTLGEKARNIADRLEVARKKRNVGVYERAGAISDAEAEEIVTLAKSLRKTIADWLVKFHPELIRRQEMR